MNEASLYRERGNPTLQDEETPPEFLGFTQVSNAVILNSDLSRNARLAYVILRSFMYGDKNDCFPGMATLARYLDCSEKTARGYLDELIEAGLLSKRRRGQGDTNFYTLKPLSWGSDRNPITGLDRWRASDKEDEVKEDKYKNLSERAETSSTAGKIEPKSGQGSTATASETTSSDDGINSADKGWLVKRLMSRLVSGIELDGGEIDFDQRAKWASNLKSLERKGTEPKEMRQAVDRIVNEWPRIQLSPQQALTDVRGAGEGQKSGRDYTEAAFGTRNPTATPEDAVAAIEADERTRQFAPLARRFDYTSGDQPEGRCWMGLGGDDNERGRNLSRIRSMCRRAVEEARDELPASALQCCMELTEDQLDELRTLLADPTTEAGDLARKFVNEADDAPLSTLSITKAVAEVFGGGGYEVFHIGMHVHRIVDKMKSSNLAEANQGTVEVA